MALKDKYFTIFEAAKLLGMTRRTISRWISEEQIAAEWVGRETLIENNEIWRIKRYRSLGCSSLSSL